MNKSFRVFFVLLVCAYFWHCALTYIDWHFIDYVNLIFHEAGHTIFFFAPEFLNIAAGSAFQIILPLFLSIYFFLTRQKVSGALTLLWVGQSLLNVSIYAGDALNMQLDLLGGDSVIHDWNYLLTQTNLLKYTYTITRFIYTLGYMSIILGTVFSIYFCFKKEESR